MSNSIKLLCCITVDISFPDTLEGKFRYKSCQMSQRKTMCLLPIDLNEVFVFKSIESGTH